MALRIISRSERRFPAMGTHCHVIVEGGGRALLDHAQARIGVLEDLWTRFRPDSELSRLSASSRMRVGAESFALVTRALVGWRMTAGRFDPFLGRAIVAAGYDRDYAELVPGAAPGAPGDEPGSMVGFHRTRHPVQHLDRRSGLVVLSPGTEIDSGGIGKGLAADMVSAELIRRGAVACLVNLGGDLRVRGRRPDPWSIHLEDETGAGAEPVSVRLSAGGLATSSVMRRRWRRDDGTVFHHVLDPRTGRSIRSPFAAVTAIAPQGWLAEILSKALFLGPASLLAPHRAGAVRQRWDGTVEQLP